MPKHMGTTLKGAQSHGFLIGIYTSPSSDAVHCSKDDPCVKPMLPSTWQIYNLYQVTKGSELENQLKAKFSLKTEDFVDPLSTDTKTNQGSLWPFISLQ